MYQLFVNNRGLFDPRNDELYVIDCKVTLKENKAGTITFTLGADHHLYNKIQKFTDYIHLYQNGTEIWRGRIISTPSDTLDGFLEYEGEGFFAVFNDTIQRPKVYQEISVSAYIADVLAIHNSQVSADKQIFLGVVTVTDPNNSIYKISNYDTTMDILSTRLLEVFGGYMYLRYENNAVFLDYFADYGDINSQKVYYGINLIDIIKSTTGEDLATAIIPLGAKDSDTQERLTIKSVNNDIDHVVDNEAVSIYGFIVKTAIFDDVTLPQNLLIRGYSELASRKYLKGEISISVFDLNLIDKKAEAIKLGDLIICDEAKEMPYLRVNSMQIYPGDPSQNVISSGIGFTTMTDSEIQADKVINKIENDYVTNETVSDVANAAAKDQTDALKPLIEANTSAITQTADEFEIKLSTEYSTKDELIAMQETIFTQTDDKFLFVENSINSNVLDLENQINTNQTYVQSAIEFDDGNINIRRSDSDFTVQIGYDDMTYFKTGAPGTRIDYDSIESANGVFTDSVQLVDVRWVRQPNGNNSLKWI